MACCYIHIIHFHSLFVCFPSLYTVPTSLIIVDQPITLSLLIIEREGRKIKHSWSIVRTQRKKNCSNLLKSVYRHAQNIIETLRYLMLREMNLYTLHTHPCSIIYYYSRCLLWIILETKIYIIVSQKQQNNYYVFFSRSKYLGHPFTWIIKFSNVHFTICTSRTSYMNIVKRTAIKRMCSQL